MELARGGCPRNIALDEGRGCVRTIILGGLDNVVEVRNALIEHLVVSANTIRIALHEVGLGSLSIRSRWSQSRMCVAGWNLLNVIKVGLSMIGVGCF